MTFAFGPHFDSESHERSAHHGYPELLVAGGVVDDELLGSEDEARSSAEWHYLNELQEVVQLPDSVVGLH